MTPSDPSERVRNPCKSGTYVIFRRGVWEIVSQNISPDGDLRPQWGWDPPGPLRSTWTIRHRFGPEHPEGYDEVDVEMGSDDYWFPNEMEVLAYASSDVIL
jgi:hypothetical protein